ncbi:MAG: hypothetical protein ACYC35_04505 [Pirellulales bacterium]
MIIASPTNAIDVAQPAAGARTARDPALRQQYAAAALAAIPRLLGAIDRNPYRPTYGCMDRQFWHYRTSDFPSEMYQEGVLSLALVHVQAMPGNRWFGEGRVRELAIAGMRFAARSCHADGSCDDYYPFERALGAAVFSLAASARAYDLLELDDSELLAWFERRGRWLMANDESGRLANHHALAAWGLWQVARLTGRREYRKAAETRVARVLDWQSSEGWFDEYGGADPGYQTVTIDALAKYRRASGDRQLDEPLARAAAFARWFLHPDDSYAGEYGSRGTYHFYPHGMELLAADCADAADLADGFLRSLGAGKAAALDDDRMFAHRLGNLLEAYADWSPERPAASVAEEPRRRWFPHARLLVRREGARHTVVSAARGGVFKHFAPDAPAVTDAGLVVELTDGRVAVSQMHDLARQVEFAASDAEAGKSAEGTGPVETLSVSGPLDWSRFETATPAKFIVLRLGMCLVGRWCRTLVRRLLQRRLITGRRKCPILHTRRFEFLESFRVTDLIELADPRLAVRRMSFGTDFEAAYVAASGVYQDSVLQPWTNLEAFVAELNLRRRVTVVREFA